MRAGKTIAPVSLLAVFFALGCGNSGGKAVGTGGSSSNGGTTGAGGVASSAGVSANPAGTTATGGLPATGGISSGGGSPNTGGALATGGAATTGGIPATGGATTSAGGGSAATGGASFGSGGSLSGGAGSTATRTGGASAGAGATSTGGKSAGGTATGGAGGPATGGSAAGGVGGPYSPTCPTGGTTYAYPFRNPCLALEDRVTSLLGLLTDLEKVSLLTEHQPAISRLGIAAFSTFTEGIHGLGWAAGVSAVLSTQFPQASGLGETWDPDVLTQAFAQVGNEARVYYVKNKGAQVSLAIRAPVVDLSRDPRAGRAEESLGEDPYLVGELAKALVRGLQGSDPRAVQAAATMKHFFVYNQEQNRGNNNVIVDDRNLREYYLVPFYETIVNAHGQSFMTSYNAVNNFPAVCSPMIKSVVIGEWGFDGMICTDAGAMQAAYQSYKSLTNYTSVEDAAAGVVKAGTAVMLSGNATAMQQAYADGKLTKADMDAALAGNFRMRFRLGEFDPTSPYSTVDGNSTPWTSDSAKALARLVTQKSIVLLKNDGNLLPLDKTTLKSLAVIGPNADVVVSDWYGGKPPYTVTARAGITTAVGAGVNVQYALDNTGGQAVNIATGADAAIVVVGNNPICGTTAWATCPSQYNSKEAVDRISIDLDPNQVTLIQAVFAANPKTIVVDMSSFMQAITSVQNSVPAIVHITHSSQELGNALADVLFGAYNPAGRTSVTWYKALTDIPAKNDYDIRKGRTYMYFQGTPLYPFGFGLSYTTFTYSALRLSGTSMAQGGSVTVSVDVTNSGTRAGDEVVQLYVSYPTTSVPRPIKQLQGFKRIMLAPAETKTVALSLTRAQLAYWDATAKAFAVQPGTVHLMVGGSSVDKRSEADLTVQ
jgi:beta-glucosidase